MGCMFKGYAGPPSFEWSEQVRGACTVLNGITYAGCQLKLLRFTANVHVRLIGMEACGGSHFLTSGTYSEFSQRFWIDLVVPESRGFQFGFPQGLKAHVSVPNHAY
jgi:hypothetical protein